MSVINIFEIVSESLYSVMYDTEGQNEFARLFDLWRDAEYLEDFFNKNTEDLKGGIWGDISIEEAMLKTIHEANRLEEKLVEIAELGKEDQYSTLSTLFRPLHDTTTNIEPFESNKAKGDDKNSWVRVYAIRIEANLFVITGGAIKLTRSMNERAHLLLELTKFDVVRAYLKDEDNYDNHPIFELFL